MNNKIRDQFPILKNELIYLDSASTSLKPQIVIDEIAKYYSSNSFNVFRTNNAITENINEQFLLAIGSIATFFNVTREELIFTYNASFAVNEIAQLISNEINEGDEIIISNLEHSSNYLPWLKLAIQKKAKIIHYQVNIKGEIDFEYLKQIINKKTKLISFASTFNTIGSNQNVKSLIKLINSINSNVITVVDAAQSVGHIETDFKEWDCDFVFLSAHKALGPTGLGIWYSKSKWLNKYNILNIGGGTSNTYSDENYVLKKLPFRNFVGTPNISGIIAFSKALEFINDIGINTISKYVFGLKNELEKLITNPNIEIINENINGSILLFKISGVNSKFVELYLAEKNILVRSGLFCVKTKNSFIKDLNGAVRISLHLYNTKEEIIKIANVLNNTSPEVYNSKDYQDSFNCEFE